MRNNDIGRVVVRYAAAVGVFLGVSLTGQRAKAEYMVHDGFMLHMGLGLGYTTYSETVKIPALGLESDNKASGLTGAFDLLMGGTLGGGFVLGAGLMGRSVANPTVEVGGESFDTDDATLGLSIITLFGQWYPDPTGGLFLRGGLGIGTLTWQVDGDTEETDMDGPVLSLGVGHGWWVSDEWSIGIEGQLVAGFMSQSEDGGEASGTWISPTVNAAFTYH